MVMIDFSGKEPTKDLTKPVENWMKGKFNPEFHFGFSSPFDFNYLLKNGGIRVKHIDCEDIESEGWRRAITMSRKDIRYEKGGYGLKPLENNIYWIYKYMGETIFKGVIRNKSELRKVLRQTQLV